MKGEDVYERYKNSADTPYIKLLKDKLAPIYENGKAEDLLYCWDPIMVATFLKADLFTESEVRNIQIIITGP
ncbi:hypothetical protein [Eubacterium aggregans]|uniref:hypothetical protein n=1 Tax=Eubacterium aggregans TaxID=81409 RepID=UPI003F2E8331